jgi:beta-glucanase (GH16 family)
MPRRRPLVLLALIVACATGLPSALAAAAPAPHHHKPHHHKLAHHRLHHHKPVHHKPVQHAKVAPPPVCGTDPTPVKTDGAPWVCSFDDEFDGTKLDTTKWLPLTTSKNGVKAGGGCFVDDPDNIGVSDGELHLTVRQEAVPVLCHSPKGNFYTYATAGQVTTSGKFAQTYGRFSIRARMPAAAAGGIHSALWLWPQSPFLTSLLAEIDVAEVYSALNDRAIPYLHYLLDKTTVDLISGTNVFTNNYCMIDDVTAFHDYTLVWTPTTLTIDYDGQTCLVDNVLPLGPSPFRQEYFLTLTESLGVGANAPTLQTPLPSTMDIDWVRVWK